MIKDNINGIYRNQLEQSLRDLIYKSLSLETLDINVTVNIYLWLGDAQARCKLLNSKQYNG